MSTIPNPTPRTDEDWQIAYASAQSKLESADVYGPAAGQCYVAQDMSPMSGLMIVRNFLERSWKDFDYNDMPEYIACIDRIMDNAPPE